jgi:hypothetical protein
VQRSSPAGCDAASTGVEEVEIPLPDHISFDHRNP